MHVLNVRNVHEALPEGLNLLYMYGHWRTSRNGPVIVANAPVTTAYSHPLERVLFWPERDANPFFHLMEALWMLAGREDVDWIAQYCKRLRDFSDDGRTFHGAYGYRWRNYFGFDQLAQVIRELIDRPDSRRCVVQMWDAREDLGNASLDLPCNTQVFFSRDRDGALDMTVANRSNDIIWGAYGANAVQFSFLQEYVAAGVGCPVGRYFQVSNNFHAYKELFHELEPLRLRVTDAVTRRYANPYVTGQVPVTVPLVQDWSRWHRELPAFFESMALSVNALVYDPQEPFFSEVAVPMRTAHEAWRRRDNPRRFEEARAALERCADDAWRVAALEWLARREKR